MQNFAHVTNGVVDAIENVPDGLVPGRDILVPSYALGLVQIPSGQVGEVAIGWTYASGVFAAPVVTLSAAQLNAYANAKVARLLAQERPYDLGGGVSVRCDAGTATSANLARLNVWGTADPAATTQWVDNENSVTAITGAQAQALALAVSAYTASVYDECGSVSLAVAGGRITAKAQIDAASWPA